MISMHQTLSHDGPSRRGEKANTVAGLGWRRAFEGSRHGASARTATRRMYGTT